MQIKKVRQILKSLADDTRLRLINLLTRQPLNVAELCLILQKRQSNISKHLSKLRLTGIVTDKRDGMNVYYHITKPKERAHDELLNAITDGLSELEIFKADLKKLITLKHKNKLNKKG